MSATVTIIQKPCIDCRTPVEVEIPDALEGMFRRMLEEGETRCDTHEAEFVAACEQRDTTEQATRRAQLVEQRERDCGLPPELRRLPWEADTAAVKAAKAWASGELRGLLLIGPVGRGKSCLAATAAWHRLGEEPVRWVSASALVAMLDGGFGSTERSRALGIVNSRHSLVLDDIDKARPNAYVAEMLLLAIDTRITAGAPLLVTMNTEPSELAKHFAEPYGDAIVSRLRGCCKAYRLGRSRPEDRVNLRPFGKREGDCQHGPCLAPATRIVCFEDGHRGHYCNKHADQITNHQEEAA